MINFPTSLDSLTNPIGTDSMSVVSHAGQHTNANDAIEALEAKVGADSSAVTTSHDYKLSGVTGSDKAVSKTGTETLTNKTLTSPQINFGSDANGDLIYRNGSGVTARLPIGSTDQILAVQAGVPTWVANPSASPASTTVAGVVELATTAETETGTDATRAVTPDGLHDMTTLAGAAWFLDEDTMSSDSAVKTASQQSIKAYADTKATLNEVPNTTATSNVWYSWISPIFGYTDTGPSYVFPGWVGTASSSGNQSLGGGGVTSYGSNTPLLYAAIPGSGSGETYSATDSKDIKIKWRAKLGNMGASNYMGFGIVDASTTFDDIHTSTVKGVRFLLNNTTMYYSVGDGSNNTSASISMTITNWNTYEIVFNPGTDVKFYVNGTLQATVSTNLPTGSMQFFGLGANASSTIYLSPITFSLEL